MPKFLVSGSYTLEGVKALTNEGGTARRRAVEQWCEGLGGRLESLYFAFGENDFYCIYDLSDAPTAAAAYLFSHSLGVVRVTYAVLITPEEMDEACRKTASYPLPGP